MIQTRDYDVQFTWSHLPLGDNLDHETIVKVRAASSWTAIIVAIRSVGLDKTIPCGAQITRIDL